MLFSIIVPVYNSKNFLRNCLESILSQDFRDFEVIVIDDGSTDGSSEILDNYAEKDSRITVYHFNNAGVSYSRRRGISLASGDYIIFVDSDDTINKQLLSSIYNTSIAFGYPDMIRYQANLVNDSSYKDHQRYNYNNDLYALSSGIDALRKWSQPDKKYAVYWLFAFKREIFSKVLFVTTLKCYEDVALIPILVAASEKVITIDYIGYNYTCNNEDSLTNIKHDEAERSRALDFLDAYHYAVENFAKLNNVSNMDIAFFVTDYTRRLNKKYESLPEHLKAELKSLYEI